MKVITVRDAKKVTIFHHNDSDGRASASIIYELHKKLGLSDDCFEFIEVDYAETLDVKNIDTKSLIYFVDYSFSGTENIKALESLINAECDIIWIDHHKSSHIIGNYYSNELRKIIVRSDVVRNIALSHCATVLCYMYAKMILNSIKSKSYNNTIRSYDTTDDIAEVLIDKLPLFIKYIDSWDTWKHNLPNTTEFNYGLVSMDLSPMDMIKTAVSSNNLTIFDDKVMCDRFTERCINAGKKIKQYLDVQNKKMIEDKGFEFYIAFNDRSYTCFAVNSNIASSTIFGDSINDYDIVVPFSYNGSVYKYSLYTAKDDVECDVIAKHLGSIDSLGGGGHKQAAGFQTHNLIIGKNSMVKIIKKRLGSGYKIKTEWW